MEIHARMSKNRLLSGNAVLDILVGLACPLRSMLRRQLVELRDQASVVVIGWVLGPTPTPSNQFGAYKRQETGYKIQER